MTEAATNAEAPQKPTAAELTRNWQEFAPRFRKDLIDYLIDPRRDIDKECGYPELISPTLYQMLYDRNEFAHRIVSVLPEESWALPPIVYETETDDITPFEAAIEEIFKEPHLNLWYHSRVADEISGIGHYGLLLLGIDDGQTLDQPAAGIDNRGKAVPGVEPRKLIYLRAFPEIACQIDSREQDMTNPRFGQPTMYTLKFQDFDPSTMVGSTSNLTTTITVRVHWSRVLHLADNRGTSPVMGTPRQRVMFNRICDIRKILGGSGEMFWKGGFPGLAFELAPGTDDAELDTTSLRNELDRYSNGLQRYLALAGMSAKTLAPQVAEPTSHMEEQIQAICISLGVPRRVFLGSEEAKIASTQDMRTWNKRLKRRQDEYLTPWLVQPLMIRLMALGVLPTPKNYKILWPDLNTTTDQEKSAIALTKTQAMAQYIQGNCDTIMPPKSFYRYIMAMSKEEVDDVMAETKKYQGSLAEEIAAAQAAGAPPAGTGPTGKRKTGSGGTHRAEVATVDAVRSTDRGGP